MQRFYLLVLLTFKIQAHVNTQTNLHSLHTFKTNVYTHSDKKNTHYRLAFIRLYIQSYKRAFHTDIWRCINTCLKTYIVSKISLYSFTQLSGHAVKSSYLHKNIQIYISSKYSNEYTQIVCTYMINYIYTCEKLYTFT